MEARFTLEPRFDRLRSGENKKKTTRFRTVFFSVLLAHTFFLRHTKLRICIYVYYFIFKLKSTSHPERPKTISLSSMYSKYVELRKQTMHGARTVADKDTSFLKQHWGGIIYSHLQSDTLSTLTLTSKTQTTLFGQILSQGTENSNKSALIIFYNASTTHTGTPHQERLHS